MAGQLSKRSGNGLRRQLPFPMAFGRDMDEIFNQMFNRDFGQEGIAAPSMDISETEDAYRATLELPGVKTDDIDIQVNGNVLTVTGESKNESEEEGRKFHRVERSYGSFSRTMTLPCEINEADVNAKLEGGVLTIDLPKAEEAKPSKIPVQGS